MFIHGGRRRGPAAGTALLVLLVLAGCGGSGSATGSGPTSAGGSAAASGRAGAGPGGIGGLGSVVAGVTGSADAASPDAASPSVSSPAPTGPTRSLGSDEMMMFETPSKNIGCAVSSSGARCDIAKHDWAVPARPADCDYDYGQGVTVEDGPARYVCAGDTMLGSPDAVQLAYGEVVVAGDFTCTSTKAGVTCRNTATGRGFALSRQAFTPF